VAIGKVLMYESIACGATVDQGMGRNSFGVAG
jgi:hypothetical protein